MDYGGNRRVGKIIEGLQEERKGLCKHWGFCGKTVGFFEKLGFSWEFGQKIRKK